MKTLNYSRQREAIYNYLLGTKKHPTAEMIFQGLKPNFPKMSIATVYRNLTLLEETGQIQKIPSNGIKEHYDANVDEHPHFVCRCCDRVYDLEMDNLDFLKTLANQGVDGEIERCQLVFYGKCKGCKENDNNS